VGLFGVGALWLGYGVFYYGYNRITGGNDKFISLLWPGRYTPMARDDGSGSGTSSGASSVNPQTQAFPGTGAQKGVSTLPGSGVLATVAGGGTIGGTPVPTVPVRPTPGR
jgi:hypothetical protein